MKLREEAENSERLKQERKAKGKTNTDRHNGTKRYLIILKIHLKDIRKETQNNLMNG
jgi:hypothetical protein